MANEKLIACVQEREALWDLSCKDYHNRGVVKSLWEEIADQLNDDSVNLRAKWRGLRDTFRRELSKLNKGLVVKSRWAYMENMMFLKDTIIASCNRYIRTPVNDNDNGDKLSECGDLTNEPSPTHLQEQDTNNDVLHPSTSHSSLKRKCDDDEIMMLERRKPKNAYEGMLTTNYRNPQISQLELDSDYHFLMSLLPYMKSLTPSRNRRVRLEIQQIFVDEEELQSACDMSPFTYRATPSP